MPLHTCGALQLVVRYGLNQRYTQGQCVSEVPPLQQPEPPPPPPPHFPIVRHLNSPGPAFILLDFFPASSAAGSSVTPRGTTLARAMSNPSRSLLCPRASHLPIHLLAYSSQAFMYTYPPRNHLTCATVGLFAEPHAQSVRWCSLTTLRHKGTFAPFPSPLRPSTFPHEPFSLPTSIP